MGEQYESKLKIVPLDASNQMLAFNFRCGNAVIDSFLKGPQALDPGIGKTFLWLNDKNDRILGFYNIATGCINYFDGDFMYKMGGSVRKPVKYLLQFFSDFRFSGMKTLKIA